ncbi:MULTISPECIES: adaptor protein MecA [Bacillaceae]|uniref:Adapter protein MecA 1/2 n=1 Tax=Peribacillus huizhouensis TaxID=1501239 RepID=A0ABR6CR91_9BACI|nr:MULTISPECIES: adaptor protein MecA [Bacillaceae]MBA9027231.1 adapter protein MecA 1/2 [Peribacillus huizhouensis]
MKLERLTNNKIKIFLTFDDLFDRGITIEDIKANSLKVHKLFQEMVEEACEEMNFKMSGSIAVEIFSLQAQGLIIVVSKDEEDSLTEEDEYLDLEVRIGEHPYILYMFADIEAVIQLAYCIKHMDVCITLYEFEGQYYFLIEKVSKESYDTIISLAAEYGYVSTLTIYRLKEYGNCIIPENAHLILTKYFSK